MFRTDTLRFKPIEQRRLLESDPRRPIERIAVATDPRTLDARSRGEAVAAAGRLGLLGAG